MTSRSGNNKNYKIKKHSSSASVLRDSSNRESLLMVYRSGNSNVITLPAKLKYKPGDAFILKDTNEGLFLKKTKQKTTKNKNLERDLKQIDKLAGKFSTPILSNMSPEELDEFLEGIYD